MRFAHAAAVLSAISAVSASMLETRQSPFPACAVTCITNANLGGCIETDTSCTCHNQAFISSVTNCIYSKCSGSDLATAVNTAKQICEAVGVTLTSTPVFTSTATGASATGISNSPASLTTASGSKTGTASGSSATTSSNAASSNSRPFTLAGAFGIIALSLSLA